MNRVCTDTYWEMIGPEYGRILQQIILASHSSPPFETSLKPHPLQSQSYQTFQSLSMTHSFHTSFGGDNNQTTSGRHSIGI